MTLYAVSVCLLCQLCLVGGQIMLKRAMSATDNDARPWASFVPAMATGIFLLTVWFFLWLGLLRDWELTRVFPFEALSPLLLALGAWVFLRERISALAWFGIALIGVGVSLVANG